MEKDKVQIPDIYFDDIQQYVEKKITNITLSEEEIDYLSSIQHLRLSKRRHSAYCDDKQFKAVSDLCQNLVSLSINGMGITDISPIENMTKLRVLSIRKHKIKDISPIINLKNLESLSYHSSGGENISFIAQMKQLKELNLHGSRIKDISPITCLKGLQSLSLSLSRILSIDPLREMQELKKLSLLTPKVTDLSPIVELTGLQSLSITGCPISVNIPFERFTQLNSLTMRSNGLSDISFLSCLTQLKNLSLDSNKIEDISPLRNFNQLESLSLDRNAIRDISALSQLTCLKSLFLRENDISSIEHLKELRKLRWLSLRGNKINNISPIGAMTQLSSLSLRDNKISDITALSNLSTIQNLFLDSNSIDNISPLSELDQLQNLSLIGNKISELSPLSKLSGLLSLSLDRNELTDISPLSSLKMIRRLSLIGNRIKDLDSLSHLSQLQELLLDSNVVSDISPLSKLFQLKSISLNNNRISDIAPLSELKQLQSLYLDSNNISDILLLSDMHELRILSIDNTKVTDISPLSKLNNLSSLYCQNLALDAIPADVILHTDNISLQNTTIKRQPESLFTLSKKRILEIYYSQKLIPVNEGKVIFLGDSGVGKTHTIMRIVSGGKKRSRKIPSTPGIDIIQYTIDSDKKTKIKFWDFGGQEIMQSMHQCFLTERTCYVVLVSNREPGHAMAQARMWLRTISGYTKQTSVILAVNQWNNVNEEYNIDERELKKICPTLSKTVYFSAADDTKQQFNQRLTESILKEVNRLDSVKLELPESWARIREEIENMGNHYIDIAEYDRICKRNGLLGNDNASESIRMWLLNWFNDLGICFSYHKDAKKSEPELSDFKVLQPKWLTNGIYRIINNGNNYASNGDIGHDDILTILNKPGLLAVDEGITYSESERNYVLEVMRKFNRSYDVGNNTEYVPEILPGKKPKLYNLKGYSLKITYSLWFTFLPKGFIHPLMISMRDRNYDVLWRYGVRLEGNNTMLLIEADEEKNQVSIEVYIKNGETPKPDNLLFYEARCLLLENSKRLNLNLLRQTITARKNNSSASYDLSTLLNAFLHNAITMNSNEGEFEIYSLAELLNPAFSELTLRVSRELSQKYMCGIVDALDAVCAAFPFATVDTLRRVLPTLSEAKKAFWMDSPLMIRPLFFLSPKHITGDGPIGFAKSNAAEDVPIISTIEEYHHYYRAFPSIFERYDKEELDDILHDLASIVLFQQHNTSFLREKGKRLIPQKKEKNLMINRKELAGINLQLFEWATESKLYKEAVGKDDENLFKALGKSETLRYIGSFNLMKSIWEKNTHLGIMPDYKLLADYEQKGQYYIKYRDHLSHMFKVFLFGLYIYEKNSNIRATISKKYSKEKFLSIWMTTALYHDIGYLIETEDGTRDGEEAKFVYTRLNETLSLPLSNLFPQVCYKEDEQGLKDETGFQCLPIRSLSILERQADVFKGYGTTVKLTIKDSAENNPIYNYYDLVSRKRSERVYYDHGIVSAFILLHMRKELSTYVSRYTGEENSMTDELKDEILALKELLPEIENDTLVAAKAIALHNITKKHNDQFIQDLYDSKVRIRSFCIPLSREPFAYLLRLCDELQCWDRQFFVSALTSGAYLMGENIQLLSHGEEIKFAVDNAEIEKKIRESLKGIIDPPIDGVISLCFEKMEGDLQ